MNPVFDADFMANGQMPNPDQVHLSGETFMENAQFPFYAELTARHWPVPMANDFMQAPLNEGSANQMPQTYQSLQRPFSTEIPAKQIEYPVLHRSPYPAWEQGEGGDIGISRSISRSDKVPGTNGVPASDSLPSSNANVTAASASSLITASAHPITGRYPCSYSNCAKDFGRTSDRLRHISSVHQRGQITQGKNLCPIVGCRRSYGKGLCRPDKVNDHLRKVHGLVRVTTNGASASAGPSAHGTDHSSNVAGGAAALAGNGN
ncbi:uncharacterized protein EAE98_010921 [Botrytis deweyae]|uniref:C2H2-type domain-containing protein n=1 Tax=Botrytis deweyae TaxID=2478750 RepID=A0ABQ7I7A4_9HELO|nr:uncharacterized protein EAE98_010921 [Botrytis deweyae]KAF7915841.1 hypothetical protein EAE98_010921 [Botrytis deweyae]